MDPFWIHLDSAAMPYISTETLFFTNFFEDSNLIGIELPYRLTELAI